MNSVEKVKKICKDRKIPVSRLEKDLGFANGYIGQLKKGTFPDDRLSSIAKYLNVPQGYLLGIDEEVFFSEENSKEICGKIVEAYNDGKVSKTFFIPNEIKEQIWSGTYRFSNVTFPQFKCIVGDMEEKDFEQTVRDLLPNEEEELREYLLMLVSRPECRALLKTAQGSGKEEVEENVRFIEALRKSKKTD